MNKKTRYLEPVTKNILIPAKISNIIENAWDSKSDREAIRNRNVIAYRIVAHIYSEQRSKEYYVAIPSSYFMKLYASTYREVLTLLLEEGVLETFASKTSEASYVTTATAIEYSGNPEAKGLSKKYKITDKFFIPLLELVEDNSESKYIVYKNNFKQGTKKAVNKRRCKSRKSSVITITYSPKKSAEEYENEFLESINSLEIDILKIEKAVKERIESFNVEDYKVPLDILKEDDIYVKTYFLNSKAIRYFSYRLSRLKKEVKKDGKYIFKDKDSYYVGTLQQFREYKIHNMEVSYTETVNSLKRGDFYAKRNTSNGRLDTNITNMPNFILDILKTDNKLESIDLSNSQISILTHILEKTDISEKEDFKEFRKLCYNGTIYNTVAKKKGITRSEAKTGFFEVLFGKVNGKYKVKELLRELFPSVIEWTDEYKRNNSYKALSKLLQNKESEIFIDNIYERLRDELDFVLTKHDSIIYKIEDREKVKKVVSDFFKEIDFKGKMVIE